MTVSDALNEPLAAEACSGQVLATTPNSHRCMVAMTPQAVLNRLQTVRRAVYGELAQIAILRACEPH